ncbi:MAG: DUF1549 domain-containing protein [Planctomycetaceae bacterium]
MMKTTNAVAVFSVALLGCLSLQATAAEPQPSAIRVYPKDVRLTTSRDSQSLVVQAVYPDGITRDVTAKSQMTLANKSLAKLSGAVLTPLADGSTELTISHAGQTVKVPVVVEKSKQDRPISFQLDVMPVFMKAGCNMGSCHGAARGKDGFRLSLFGFDPAGDHFRLTREVNGRRINLALPHESLLIEKSIGIVPHTGGKRFDKNSEYYKTLIRWLEAGAPKDQTTPPKVVSVELSPPNAVLDGKGSTQQLTVRANYSDGTNRDVTSQAVFLSNNDNSATVFKSGVVTAQNRGEAFIMARFETHTVGSQFIVLPKGLKFAWSNPPENNYIDKLINAKLKKLRILPSKLCTDEEFVRRVYLDVVGVLPTTEEYYRFMESRDPQKRTKLVDELLGRKEFVELWVMKWAELLQIRTTRQTSYKAMLRYYNWLQAKIANNVPMDKMVQELLGSNGGTFANAATNYYQNERNTLKVAENVAQVFMGMRIQCAQCHNHPFDRWTMDDYYGFAAFFSQIGRKRGEDPRELIIYNRGSGDVRHPVGNRVMAPKFLGGDVPDVRGKDRRVVLAQWLASPKNPYFAKNLANIVWAHFFGKGIINEVDDVRVSNPAVNPELLNELASRFTSYKYDFKRLVRDICTSRTYQLSTETNPTNESDERNFSRAYLRRLRAEVLLDAISQVTETKNKFQGLPLGSRAVQIANGNTSTYFLTTFGRAKRETVCSCEVKMEPNLSQALHMLNGNTVNQKIQSGGFIARQLKAGKTPEKLVDELYVRVLTRAPYAKERSKISELLASEKNKQQVLEDVFWALLNSREFLFNH